MKNKLAILISFGLLTACATTNISGPSPISPIAETVPVGVAGDAADDPAIWLSNDNKSSRIIGTQKKGGIYLYDLDGKITQEILGGRPNNVDIRNDFIWEDGQSAPIVVTSDRIDNTAVIYRFNAEKEELISNPVLRIDSEFAEIYGICIGNFNGETLVGATSKLGDFKVFKLENNGKVSAKLVSQISLGSISEGCVFDDVNQKIYVSQELYGIWQLSLEQNSLKKQIVDTINSPYLKADIEGLSIWRRGDKSYLIASIQGISEFAIYNLAGEMPKYLKSFKVGQNSRFDEVSGTDGIDVHAGNFGKGVENGIMVVQDDVNTNPNATQNFKIIDFGTILNAIETP